MRMEMQARPKHPTTAPIITPVLLGIPPAGIADAILAEEAIFVERGSNVCPSDDPNGVSVIDTLSMMAAPSSIEVCDAEDAVEVGAMDSLEFEQFKVIDMLVVTFSAMVRFSRSCSRVASRRV